MNLASQIRHYLTFLAGLGGLFLSWQIIAPDQVEAVNQAGAALIEPLVILIGVIVAGVARLVIGWIGSFFGRGAGGAGKPSLWMVGLISTAAVLGGLPSCAALKGVPIAIGITSDQGDVSYSSKGGLMVSARVPSHVDRRSSK